MLFSLNLNDCTSRLIGSFKSGTTRLVFNDIAFTPDGKLYGYSSNEEGIYLIDTLDATARLIINYKRESALESLNDSILLTTSKTQLIAINIKNFTTKNLGDIGFLASGDLTWLNENLFMSSPNKKLIKMILNENKTAIQSLQVFNLNKNFELFGLGVVSLSHNRNFLIGFEKNSVYSICEYSGEVNPLCLNIFKPTYIGSEVILGGATMRFPILEEFRNCHIPSNFPKELKIFPNPISNSGALFIRNLPEDSQYVGIKIFDPQGKEIFSKPDIPNSSEIKLDLKGINLSNGIYFIEINLSNQRFYSKLIVQ